MSLDIVTWTELSVAEQKSVLQRPALGSDALVRKRVEKIINKVRESGDAALKEFTRQLDGVELDRSRVSDDEFDQAEGELSSASMNAIELAIANVTRFHERQVPEHIDMVDIFRRSELVAPVVDEAIEVGVKYIWMQDGVVNPESAAKAEAVGIPVIMDD